MRLSVLGKVERTAGDDSNYCKGKNRKQCPPQGLFYIFVIGDFPDYLVQRKVGLNIQLSILFPGCLAETSIGLFKGQGLITSDPPSGLFDGESLVDFPKEEAFFDGIERQLGHIGCRIGSLDDESVLFQINESLSDDS